MARCQWAFWCSEWPHFCNQDPVLVDYINGLCDAVNETDNQLTNLISEVNEQLFDPNSTFWNNLRGYSDSNDIWLYDDYRSRDTALWENLNPRLNNEITQRQTTDEYLYQDYNQQIAQTNQNLNETANGLGLQMLDYYNRAVGASQAITDAAITGVTGLIGVNRNDIDNIINAAGRFIQNPLQWMLTLFETVLIVWLLENIASLIAVDESALPPKSNYTQLMIDAGLI